MKRMRFTQSQTTKTLKEREENIEGAFIVRKTENVKGKNILLVDDVMTTGATINECGKVLLDAGANKIYAATVALGGFLVYSHILSVVEILYQNSLTKSQTKAP